MKITIRDIAKNANVSEAAVSLALNNKPGVSEETRQYILDIARKMGYQRPISKKNGESRLIRFLLCYNNDIVNSHYYDSPFFMALIKNIEKACNLQGYALLISTTELSNLEASIHEYEINHPSLGLILLGTNVDAQDVLTVQKYQPNLVVLDNYFDTIQVDCVCANIYMAGYQAAKHILKKGFKRIGYVQATQRPYNLEQSKKGFFDTLHDNGVDVPEKYIYSITNSTEEGYRDFKNLLAEYIDDLPEVLFCEDDYMALGVMRALSEEGISIPETVSVIGVDNIALASTAQPALTTIQVDTEAMSKVAVARIIEIINNNKQPTMKFIIDTTLIERDSCR